MIADKCLDLVILSRAQDYCVSKVKCIGVAEKGARWGCIAGTEVQVARESSAEVLKCCEEAAVVGLNADLQWALTQDCRWRGQEGERERFATGYPDAFRHDGD